MKRKRKKQTKEEKKELRRSLRISKEQKKLLAKEEKKEAKERKKLSKEEKKINRKTMALSKDNKKIISMKRSLTPPTLQMNQTEQETPIPSQPIPSYSSQLQQSIQPQSRESIGKEEGKQLPSHVLEELILQTTQLEKVFLFSKYQEELDSFRMLNLNQIAYIGRDLYLATLLDVIHLLPLIYEKEYCRQLLFYSNDFEPNDILLTLVDSFAHYIESDKPQRQKYCSNCIKILSSWLTTRGDTFTNEKLLLMMRDFIEGLKTLAQTNEFLMTDIIEVERIIGEVFESKGIVTFKHRIAIPQNENEIQFDEITIRNEQLSTLLPDQLSHIEFLFLRKINPKDYYLYLDKKTRKSSPVYSYIFWHDLLSQWVAYEICRQQSIEHRYECIIAFFNLSLLLLKKKNFNSFVSILNGLNHQTVKRLTKTWNLLSKSDWLMYQDLLNVFEKLRKNNYSIALAPPCVPDFVYQMQRMQDLYDQKKLQQQGHQRGKSSVHYQVTMNAKDLHAIHQMIDLSKYAKIGAIIDVLGVYATGGKEIVHKQIHEFFKSTIQTMPLDDFNLLDLSLEVEPPQ